MKLDELTEFLIKSISKEKDSVSVKMFEDEELITVEVLVSNDDMGRIIGKGGNTINAIRTIVQASAYANNLKHVKINIDAI